MRHTALIFAVFALAQTGCSDNQTHPVTHGAYQTPEPTPLACVPNLDGHIDASEIQPAIDIPISYLISPAGVDREVNLVGTDLGGGVLRWDFGVDYADDQAATIMPTRISGKWYESSFPPDAFVAPFDAGGTVDNVLRQDDQAVWLLGVTSHEADPPEGKTLLVYDAPIAILRFPVQPGASYVSASTVQNGILRGLPYAGKDTYEVGADAVGTVLLTSLEFTQVHRVRTKVTVEPAVGASTSRRQVSFFFECFAEVVRATSKADEPEPDFAVASELRRLGF